MTFYFALFNIALAGINAGLYAAFDSPVNLGAAVFAGLLGLVLAKLAVDGGAA